MSPSPKKPSQVALAQMYEAFTGALTEMRTEGTVLDAQANYAQSYLKKLEALDGILQAREAGNPLHDEITAFKELSGYGHTEEAVARGERVLVTNIELYNENSKPFMDIGMDKNMIKVLSQLQQSPAGSLSNAELCEKFKKTIQEQQPAQYDQARLNQVVTGLADIKQLKNAIILWQKAKEDLDNTKGILEKDRQVLEKLDGAIERYKTEDISQLQHKHQLEFQHWKEYTDNLQQLQSRRSNLENVINNKELILRAGRIGEISWSEVDVHIDNVLQKKTQQ